MEKQGNFTPTVVAWMARRSEQFQLATSGKGKPMVYGSGKVPGADR